MLPTSETASTTIIAVRPISAISRRSPTSPVSMSTISASARTAAMEPIRWNILTFSSFVSFPFGRLVKGIDVTSKANPHNESNHHKGADRHVGKEKVAVHCI